MTGNLIECECHKCRVIGESRFTWSGPHLKQSCNNCGSYKKFFDKSLLPSVEYTKQLIWDMVNKDLDVIVKAKEQIHFVEGLSGVYAKLEYYKLFKQLSQ